MVPIEDVKLLEALEDKIDLEEARAALAELEEERHRVLGEDQERAGHIVGLPD